jgi:putative transposase
VRVWSDKTEIAADRFVGWIGVARGKFFAWKKRYGKANEHNGHVPRDHWLLDEEKRKIISFHGRFPLEGYRRLAFMMIDQGVVAVSPSSVYRVLSAAGLLDRWNKKPSKKGTGFVQPLRPHEHWHIDVSYLNLGGTFYYLCSILDGASRAIVHWEIREQMTEADVECILVRAHEAHPNERPRIISDNGPQFIAKDFKEFIRLTGMTHVRTARTTRNRTARSSAGTRPSRRTPSGPASPRLSRKLASSWLAGSSTTTRSACTARSATSPRPIFSPVAATRSGPRAIASSRLRGRSAPFVVPSVTKRQHERFGPAHRACRRPRFAFSICPPSITIDPGSRACVALWTAARAAVRVLRTARAAVQVAEGNRRPIARVLQRQSCGCPQPRQRPQAWSCEQSVDVLGAERSARCWWRDDGRAPRRDRRHDPLVPPILRP